MKGIADQPSSVAIGRPGLAQVHGSLDGQGLRIGVVTSRFNDTLTVPLATACVDGLLAHGVAEANVVVAWVPGAFEIPLVIDTWAESGGLDALIALGVVIEGETSHALTISNEVSRSLANIARERRIPVIDGVICAKTWKNAEQRAATGEKSRGWYAAKAAIEMAVLMKQLRSGHTLPPSATSTRGSIASGQEKDS